MEKTIIVQVDIQRFSQNQRPGGIVRKRTKSGKISTFNTGNIQDKRLARSMGKAAWIREGKPVLNPPCALHITVHRARWLDYFNIHGACKSLIDGICWSIDPVTNKRHGNILPDDAPKYLKPGEIHQDIDKRHKGREFVEFRFEELTLNNGDSLWQSEK